VREVEVIGEAVKNLPMGYYVKYPHVPWKEIAGLGISLFTGILA
jgi:uncharacterized protein with HEPN domain